MNTTARLSSEAPHAAAKALMCRQRRLALATLLVALCIGLGLPALVQTVNLVKVAGIPLGFYIAAQGAPLILGVVLFLYARRANRLDRRGDAVAGEGP